MTQGQSQVNLLSISQFAKACRTTPRTLRFYEQKGLFRAFWVDEFNSYRYYNPQQVRDFLKIKLLQNFHLPLKEISSTAQLSSGKKTLDKKINTLNKEIKERQKEIQFLKNIKSFLFGQVNFKELLKQEGFGPYNLFCLYVENAQYNKIHEYVKTLRSKAKSIKLNCDHGELTFYLDSKFSPKNTKLEIALICKGRPKIKRTLPENFYFRKLSIFKSLVYYYTGPYEYLPLIYQKLYSYMDDQKISIKDPIFEKYIQEPPITKSKYDYLTKIAFPVS